jgi:hypothetical protein
MAVSIKVRRVIVYVVLSAGIATFTSSIAGYEWLRSYGPRQPNYAAGQLYPKKMQQPFDVYLTKAEEAWVTYGIFLGVLLGFIAVGLNNEWQVIGKTSSSIVR